MTPESVPPKHENPWDVTSIYAFQFFNCPSCLYRGVSKQDFVCHAFNTHPESTEYFRNISDKSLSDVLLPWMEDQENQDFHQPKVKVELKEEDSESGRVTQKSSSGRVRVLKYEYMNDEEILDFEQDVLVDDFSSSFQQNIPNEYDRKSFRTHIRRKRQRPKKSLAKKYNCELCSESFTLGRMLRHHKYNVHNVGEKNYKCEICDPPKAFFTPEVLKNHLYQRHDCQIIECEKCHQVMPDVYLKIHDITNHGEYICDSCGKKFEMKKEMETHVLNVHKGGISKVKKERPATKDYSCELCGKEFYYQKSIYNHIQRVHVKEKPIIPKVEEGGEQNNNHICDECGRIYKNPSLLKRHIQASHNKQKVNVKCEKCGEIFPTMDKYKYHNRYVHDREKYSKACDYCGQICLSAHLLKVHKDTVHKENPHKFTCEACGKGFYNKLQIRRHQETVHEGRRDYKCEICGQRFAGKGGVQRHIKTVHEGRKDHKCEYCGESRTTSSSLKKHILTHFKN